MAISSRGLAIVLTMAAWLPASIHTGSLQSGWWGTTEALRLRQTAALSISQGNFEDAERLYLSGVELGARHQDPLAQAWFLDGAGSARLAGLHFSRALEAYLEAKNLAEKARNRAALGAIDGDLASVYEQMGDFDSALIAAREALAIALPDAYYRPQVLFLLGRLLGDQTSIPLYKEGIEAARKQVAKDPTQVVLEAYGWDLLCQALAQPGGDAPNGNLDAALDAEQNALALRLKSDARDLGFSSWLLGGLKLRQAALAPPGSTRKRLLNEAEDFTRRAAQEKRRPPAYHLAYQRGRILLAQHRPRRALEALEEAVVEAQRWRLGLVPTLNTIDGAAADLQTGIFDGFIETAAEYGWRTGERRWIEESLEAAELNRAVNLHDSAQNAPALTPHYRELLAQLQAEETKSSQEKMAASPLADRLRLELTELEAKAGLGFSPNIAENFPSHNSLIHFQTRLGDSEIFLSFALEQQQSFLWAVTRNSLNVYRLPPKAEIVGAVREFRHAIEEGRPGQTVLGQRLYRMLFGQLRATEEAKSAWEISAESALLEVPFAALVTQIQGRSGRTVFLAEKHSLQVKAGALLADRLPQSSPRGFVSVGDPIYNSADPRWAAATGAGGTTSWLSRKLQFFLSAGAPGEQLNRLPGTRREVEASAAAWWDSSAKNAGVRPIVLEGAAATRARFLQSISPAPAVIHLATHALATHQLGTPSGDEAFLAFTLGPDGRPEMLGAQEIRSLRVPGSVVVMTGCTTAPSEVRPGLGLAGLVRAWTVAGASAIVATEWPVQDGDNSAGSALIESFYRHLGASAGSSRAPETAVAEALRQAQVEMIADARHTAGAAVWAAYQVFTGRVGADRNAP